MGIEHFTVLHANIRGGLLNQKSTDLFSKVESGQKCIGGSPLGELTVQPRPPGWTKGGEGEGTEKEGRDEETGEDERGEVGKR